jgi:hypothetical protein
MAVARWSDISAQLEAIGGGFPRVISSPKGASQFIFPNGMILRFDLLPGQYLPGQAPHVNLEYRDINFHIELGR